ncbi:mucin-like protein [Lethenteron reissneri]|uniref:mucin-like protein n=1 Tax=Lethenteron reissneri TaxID=7753 RepID=UPI002AB78F4F|nr:mucin-like protein [Lethenteron reissneri]
MQSINGEEQLVIGGDLNGHVGSALDGYPRNHGGQGYGTRNDEGNRALDFAEAHDLVLANTFFKKRPSHLITYASGGRSTQIDYWLVKRDKLKTVTNTKVIPSDNIAPQHRILVMDIKMDIGQRHRPPTTGQQRIKWWRMKECKDQLRVAFNQIDVNTNRPANAIWEDLAGQLCTAATEALGLTKPGKHFIDKQIWWWNEEVQLAVKEKKLAFKKWRQTLTDLDYQHYRNCKSAAKRVVAAVKLAQYDQLYVELDTPEDVDPFRYCCQSGDNRLCSLYHQRRPINRCTYYRPPFFAFLIGDPHVTTLDNAAYTFNGLGEYTVLEAFGENITFTMQARTAIAGVIGVSKATSFVAIVAQENGSAKVEWILKNNITIILVDGDVANITDSRVYFNKTSVWRSENSSITASFPSGISVNVTASYGALNFITMLPESFINMTQGLLGVFNKDPTDDFRAANGTVLPFNGTDVPSESRIYYEFGVTWQITANTSLFSYNTSDGESWHTYNNNTFVPLFYEDLINQTSPERLAFVNASCGGQKDCIFDVLSTNDTNFGMATKNSAGDFGSQGQALQNFPPNITTGGRLFTSLNQTVSVQINAKDPNNDTIVFSMATNSSGLTVTPDGNLTWSPRSSKPAFDVVSASDGKASSALLLNLTLCNCSAHSTCLYNQTTLSMNSSDGSSFQVAGCLCDPGYAGAYCTDDYNACVDSPCHPGVTCTDQPAPSLGFSCGPCPVGLTGNRQQVFR